MILTSSAILIIKSTNEEGANMLRPNPEGENKQELERAFQPPAKPKNQFEFVNYFSNWRKRIDTIAAEHPEEENRISYLREQLGRFEREWKKEKKERDSSITDEVEKAMAVHNDLFESSAAKALLEHANAVLQNLENKRYTVFKDSENRVGQLIEGLKNAISTKNVKQLKSSTKQVDDFIEEYNKKFIPAKPKAESPPQEKKRDLSDSPVATDTVGRIHNEIKNLKGNKKDSDLPPYKQDRIAVLRATEKYLYSTKPDAERRKDLQGVINQHPGYAKQQPMELLFGSNNTVNIVARACMSTRDHYSAKTGITAPLKHQEETKKQTVEPPKFHR